MRFYLQLGKLLWKEQLKSGPHLVVDATSGRGHDALFLATQLFPNPQNRLLAFDIQLAAIQSSRELLTPSFPFELEKGQICLFQESHADFGGRLQKESVDLFVYNLGYLPGSDKQITTLSQSTIHSLESALTALKPGGMISLTCYPGHPEGENEAEALKQWTSSLSYEIAYHSWPHRPKCPFLVTILKNV